MVASYKDVIPEGYIGLLDYCKAENLDTVQMAIACWRGDVEYETFLIRDRQNTCPCEIRVMAVRREVAPPFYVEPAKPDDYLKSDCEKQAYISDSKTIIDMGVALNVSATTVRRYLKELGIAIKDCKTPEGFVNVLKKCREFQIAIWSSDKGKGAAVRSGKREVDAPEGYETLEEASQRLGHKIPWIKALARQGRIDSVKHKGCMFISKTAQHKRKRGNQYTKRKEGLQDN